MIIMIMIIIIIIIITTTTIITLNQHLEFYIFCTKLHSLR